MERETDISLSKEAFSDLFRDIFRKNGLETYCTEAHTEAFYRLTVCLLETNRVMNVTAITDPARIIALHYADCVRMAAWIPEGAHVADIGCGGGFPTLPLAIVRPDLHLTGIDSTEKKVRYVGKTAALLGLSDSVRTISARAEELTAVPHGADSLRTPDARTATRKGKRADARTHIRENAGANPRTDRGMNPRTDVPPEVRLTVSPDETTGSSLRETFDVVISRAVARLSVLDELCLPFVRTGGLFVAMKGAAGMEELKEAENGIVRLGGRVEEKREERLFLSDGEESRVTVLIRKAHPTPPEFPRPFGAIKKKPL